MKQHRTDEQLKLLNKLFEKYEINDSDKAQYCFDLAWEYGHSLGYSEVEGYFTDMVELILPEKSA